MADCTAPSTPSAPQSAVEILRKLQTLGLCSDLQPCGIGESVSSFFDRILAVFFMDVYKRSDNRPLPALLGDGLPVDLFRLFSVVQEKGGSDSVTAGAGWASVAEDVGFEPQSRTAVKLVFVKYLCRLEQWIKRVSGRKVCRRLGCENWTRLMVRCVKEESRDVKEDGQFTPRSTYGLKKKKFLSPGRGIERRLQLENGGSDDHDVVNSVKVEGNGSLNHHKRKRDGMVWLLEWVRKVAKNPTDCSLVDVVSWDNDTIKSHITKELFTQVVRARKAMFQNISRGGILESHIQKGACLESTELNNHHNLHDSNNQLTPGSCANTLKFLNHYKHTNGLLAARRENGDVKQRLRSSSLNFEQIADSLFGDQQRIRVPVGLHFQAKVPAWTGKPSLPCTDSDELKYLGARIWPPENQENKLLLDCNSIGRGRSDSCRCKQPGSVECIRFHIAERRLQLNRELGPTFHAWGFECMGEEVALSWTEEEERKFKAIVRLYRPSLNKNCWDQLPLCFPFKGRRRLVSYYFNVFSLRRRSYQNHVTPNMIDSDDDEESESGFLSSPFGLRAVALCDS